MKSVKTTIGSVVAGLLVAGLLAAVPAQATTVLLDFGSDTSWRGATTPSPDENGNFWNSVDSFAYFPGLVDIAGTPTAMAFGFGPLAGGTDSYNGPAGPTDVNGPEDSVFDPIALGNLGATNAVYDFYDNTQFTIQGLDPSKTYNLTFYGSHKYDTPGVTTYTVFSDSAYSIAVTATTLAHNDETLTGFEWEHNQDRVVSLDNVAAQEANSIWIGVAGYVNAMQIDVIPEPGTLAMLLLGGLLVAVRRLGRR